MNELQDVIKIEIIEANHHYLTKVFLKPYISGIDILFNLMRGFLKIITIFAVLPLIGLDLSIFLDSRYLNPDDDKWRVLLQINLLFLLSLPILYFIGSVV